MDVKDKLKQILDGKENKSLNIKKLNEYFGEENLKRLPFSVVKIDLGSNSWDGNHILEVNLLNGQAQQYCTVADVDNDILLTDSCIDRIEKYIFNELKK